MLHDYTNISQNPLPSDMETYIMLVVLSKDEKLNTFTNQAGMYKFNEIMNAIISFSPSEIIKDDITFSIANYYLISILQTQTPSQMTYYTLYYRYHYFFTFKNDKFDMSYEFQKFFGTEYNVFLLFGLFLSIICFTNELIPQEILTYLYRKFIKCAEKLTIERSEYQLEINKYANKVEDLLYCVRPSYSFPFIAHHGIAYLPLPHLLVQSTTSSLLYRLTHNNNELMNLFGKEVVENYLEKILRDSGVYTEITSEVQYKGEHNYEKKSLDVLCREDNEYILFDSKSFRPKSMLRNFDNNAILSDLLRMAKTIVQAYCHAVYEFPTSYNPFSPHVPASRENVWAIIVILEDSFISRRKIYEKARELIQDKYKAKITDEDFRWLQKHIKIYDLYSIERYSFAKRSVIFALHEQDNMTDCYDFQLHSSEVKGSEEQVEYNQFTRFWDNKVIELADELHANGIM